MEIESEPPADENALMSNEEFDREVKLAGEGRWDELGLDTLPENWKPASIDELRNPDEPAAMTRNPDGLPQVLP
jgi:hypothetical protein